jgi:hypothetical protein
MRVYSKTGKYKSDTTYHFLCEYCGHEYSVEKTFEREVKVERLSTPPTVQDLLATAQEEFKRHQNTILSNAEKWVFAVDKKSAVCPNCGFLPTYLINRKQTISTIILLLIASAGPAIPFFIPGGVADAAMAVTISLLCFVPILIFLVVSFLRLNPNRKLMHTLSTEGRSLTNPEKPRIVFSPVLPKLD